MSKLGKSQKFEENKSFKCLIQPKMDEVFRKDYSLKNRWKSEVFGNDNPIVIELGCGKGEYTIALAERNPNKNFIGIDIKGARIWKGAKYVETNGLKNVIFLRTRIDFIEWIFGEGEISEIWITFPDPQLSRFKKRLTSTLFLERYRKILIDKGLIHLKTDSQYLHTYTSELAKQNSFEIISDSCDIYNKEENGNFPEELLDIQTFYESFYIRMGLPITYLCFKLAGKEPLKIVEPNWDESHWKEVEEIGREHKRIQ